MVATKASSGDVACRTPGAVAPNPWGRGALARADAADAPGSVGRVSRHSSDRRSARQWQVPEPLSVKVLFSGTYVKSQPLGCSTSLWTPNRFVFLMTLFAAVVPDPV